MTESGVIKNTALVFGQMNEPPGSRMRVAQTGLTMAEYFRCLLYTSDAADEEDSVDLGGRRIIKKKNK